MEEIQNKFVGKWKLERSEGFEDFLREVGVPYLVRKIAARMGATVTIATKDDQITIETASTAKTTRDEFILDKEYDKVIENVQMKAKGTYADGVLTLTNTPVDPEAKVKPQTVTREIEGGELFTKICVGDVVCKRYFSKIPE